MMLTRFYSSSEVPERLAKDVARTYQVVLDAVEELLASQRKFNQVF